MRNEQIEICEVESIRIGEDAETELDYLIFPNERKIYVRAGLPPHWYREIGDAARRAIEQAN